MYSKNLHNHALAIICALALFTAINAQIRLPLTKQYFTPNQTNLTNDIENNNGFLTDAENIADDTVDNTYYTVVMQIGSQKQNFSLVFDTLTAWTWVVASNGTESNSANHFDCNSSSTCSIENTLFPISYSDGTVIQGSLIEDAVYLDDVEIKDQRFVLATGQLSFAEFPADGMLGLGFSSALTPNTVLDNLQSQGILPDRNFSIYLSNHTVDNTSELIIGGFDPSHMLSADFVYYPLSEDSTWAIALSSVNFGNTTFSSGDSVKFDSRASAITASRDDFASLLSAAQSIDSSCDSESIAGSTFIRCQCNNATEFPLLQLTFASNEDQYSIRADQYFFQDNGNCVIAINQAGLLDDSWAIGHQFMRNFYTFYDVDNEQIGIAEANHTSST
jgi:hypothetical protein